MEKKQVENTDNARKRKRIIPTRTAGTPANPAFNNPADELFAEAFANRVSPAESEILSLLPQVVEEIHIQTETSITAPTLPTLPSQGRQEQQKRIAPVAPVKNYQKVTNTITREAIPQGLFKPGKSKQIYDVLYGLTRGALTPKRIVRISKPKLRALAGVGARTTMDACLNHLEHVGLIHQQINDGGFHEGNEYEIFTPEEIENLSALTLPTLTRQGRQGYPAYPASKQGRVGSLETEPARQGSEPINTGAELSSKTSFKTNAENDDDDEIAGAFMEFIKKFQDVSETLTGKKQFLTENQKWGSLAELLIFELKMAEARTPNGISSIPAFLTEVLRRRLNTEPKQQTPVAHGKKQNKSSNWADVGKYHPPEIEPLSEEKREYALTVMVECLKDFPDANISDWSHEYVKSDWEWLMNELKKFK